MMRTLFSAALAWSLLSAVGAQAAGPEIQSEEEKTIYAIGLTIARSLETFALSPAEIELVQKGISDGLGKTAKIDFTQYGSKVKQLAQQRLEVIAAAEKRESQAFLEKMSGETGAEKTPSGLIFIPLKAGSGEAPKPADAVEVHYHGTLRDGSVFDSSVERGQPASFQLNRVIPCWTEGLQKMKVGGKARLVCPAGIAYGDRGSLPKIKPGAALVFEVELLAIKAPAAAPAPPPAAVPTPALSGARP